MEYNKLTRISEFIKFANPKLKKIIFYQDENGKTFVFKRFSDLFKEIMPGTSPDYLYNFMNNRREKSPLPGVLTVINLTVNPPKIGEFYKNYVSEVLVKVIDYDSARNEVHFKRIEDDGRESVKPLYIFKNAYKKIII